MRVFVANVKSVNNKSHVPSTIKNADRSFLGAKNNNDSRRESGEVDRTSRIWHPKLPRMSKRPLNSYKH